jgi:hypothetical protein
VWNFLEHCARNIHCAKKHLHRYLAEFDFRYNHCIKLGINDGERAALRAHTKAANAKACARDIGVRCTHGQGGMLTLSDLKMLARVRYSSSFAAGPSVESR